MTQPEADVLRAERTWFDGLLAARVSQLEALLTKDFQIIDVSSGAEADRAMLLGALGAGQLRFEAIDVLESRTRRYGDTVIVTGRTRMQGRFQGQPFGAHSRYTHVFVRQEGGWRLASAQGTPIVDGA
jgi:ketosteroid isomerase-like protein